MKEYLKEFIGKKATISYYYVEDIDNYSSSDGRIVDVIDDKVVFKTKDGIILIPLRLIEMITPHKKND